jgi:hypothetical protein
MTTEQLARTFQRAPTKCVAELRETLVSFAQPSEAADGWYVRA